jgi:hypothetical protein
MKLLPVPVVPNRPVPTADAGAAVPKADVCPPPNKDEPPKPIEIDHKI